MSSSYAAVFSVQVKKHPQGAPGYYLSDRLGVVKRAVKFWVFTELQL